MSCILAFVFLTNFVSSRFSRLNATYSPNFTCNVLGVSIHSPNLSVVLLKGVSFSLKFYCCFLFYLYLQIHQATISPHPTHRHALCHPLRSSRIVSPRRRPIWQRHVVAAMRCLPVLTPNRVHIKSSCYSSAMMASRNSHNSQLHRWLIHRLVRKFRWVILTLFSRQSLGDSFPMFKYVLTNRLCSDESCRSSVN